MFAESFVKEEEGFSILKV